ncbi:MAG: hypothetical protein H8E12_09175 [Rhodobacteraceae bacterium]|nr:hypothetical protein [Paracoccaceae bacterium]
MIKYSETCLLAGTWLLVTNNSIIGYTLIALSLFFAMFRFLFDIQEKKVKQDKVEDGTKKMLSVIQDLFSYYGTNNGNQEKTVLH